MKFLLNCRAYLLLALTAVWLCYSGPAMAQSWPQKPIKIIVPFPAGPAGTPKPVVDKLHAEVQRIVAMPEIKERLTTLGAEALAMSPDQFGQWLKQEMTTMAKVVHDVPGRWQRKTFHIDHAHTVFFFQPVQRVA